MQLDLFEWQPREAEIIEHPMVMARNLWMHQVHSVADGIVNEPQNAARYWTTTPKIVFTHARAAGATEAEADLQSRLWLKALAREVERLSAQHAGQSQHAR